MIYQLNHLILGIAFGCLGILQATAASVSWQPSATMEIVTGAGPGTVHDRLARATQQAIQEGKLITAVSLIVQNKPGAGGTIALGYLDRKPNDAHFIATASGSILTTFAMGKTPYNFADYPVLSLPFNDYAMFTVRADSAIKSGKDLVEKLRADPTSVSFAYATAPGNYSHIAIAAVANAANADLSKVLLVVHTGGAKAMTEVLGGHVDVVVGGSGNVLGQIQAGKMRALGIAAPQRYKSPEMAAIPTWKEQGVDAIADTPYFFVGPKGITKQQIDFWEKVLLSAYKMPSWQEYAQRSNVVTLELGHAEAKKYLEERYQSYRASLERLGLAK